MAIHALHSFAITVKSIEFINHSENATFKITARNGEHFLLRIHRADYHSVAALRAESRWLGQLLRHRLDVPRRGKTKIWIS